jgi:hypothetical protein
MTTTENHEPEQDPIAEALTIGREVLAEVRALRDVIKTLTPVEQDRTGAWRTAASVRLVAMQMLAGQDLTGLDDFWVRCAQREIAAAARECDRVITAAVRALAHKRYHAAQARQIAIAVLLASHHPAVTNPLLGLAEWSEARTDDDPDEGGVARSA